MSRHSWTTTDGIEFVAGVDSVTGSFIQIWTNPNADCATLVIDNQGSRTGEGMDSLPLRLLDYLKKRTFPPGYNLDEQTAIRIAMLLGLRDVAQIIYQLWD